MKFRYTVFLLLSFFWQNTYAGNIFINQLGYLPNQEKYFITDQLSDSFYIINVNSGRIEYSGAVEFKSFFDAASGSELHTGNFTSFSNIGKYIIKTSLGDTSFNFEISPFVFQGVYKHSLKAFYFQRCGTQLFSTHAGIYNRLSCHAGDGFFHSSTGQNGFLPANGGWHDAGDYGKYVVNAGITLGTLLSAYEYHPNIFNTDSLNIPESNNSIPDILDEIRYELNWYLKMQNSNGSVYFKLTKEKFENIVMPAADAGMRNVYQISTTATGNFAAVLARAYRVFKNYDQAFADKCLNASKLAWTFIENNQSILPIGGFKNPAGTETGEYGDSDDRDERLWVAAELFESTGEEKYNQFFKSNYNTSSLFSSSYNWGNVKSMALITYLYSKQSSVNNEIKTELLSKLAAYCNNLISNIESDGFNVVLKPGQYNWGSNSNVLNNAILLIDAFSFTKDKKYFDAALKQFNYILGLNINNISYVTGMGYNHVMNPHHRPSLADNIVEPIPGFLAGGPNEYLNDPVLAASFNSSTPPARCYVDHSDSWASNEIAINWNAPLVYISGYFNYNENYLSIDDSKDQSMNFKLNNNYPNPFNSSTIISFYLPNTTNVNFKIFDVSGQIIYSKEYANLSEGENIITWNGIDTNGNHLASGMYIYNIEGDNFSKSQKLMLLK